MIKKSYQIRIFKDSTGEWRWRMKSGNGRIVSTSAEGYTRESDAYSAAERLMEAKVVIVRPRGLGRTRLDTPPRSLSDPQYGYFL